MTRHRRLMAHWQSLLPGSVIEVRYEDLVTSTREETARIAAFCGLSENDRIEPHLPIHAREMGRWSNYRKTSGIASSRQSA